MSDSDESPDESHVQKTIEQKPDCSYNRKDLPKRMRTRYWHSWEEMIFVEQWRKHFDEVTSLDNYLPIFRTISVGMRESGFHVTGQEVQRKIKSIKNKYIAERRRLNESGDKDGKSEWALYPLVHCLMKPPQKSFDLSQEEKTLNAVLERNRSDPMYHILKSGMPVVSTLEKYEAGEIDRIPSPFPFEDSFPVQNQKVADCIAYSYENKNKRSFTPRSQRPSEIAAAHAKLNASETKATPSIRTEIDTLQPATAFPIVNQPISSNKALCGMTLKGCATPQSIKQLRLENRRLVEECVMNTKRLKMEEQQIRAYEAMFEQWLAQHRNF